MDYIHFLFLVLQVFLMGFIPGRVLTNLLPYDKEIKAAASFAVSFFIYYLVGFLTYIFKLPASPIHLGLFLTFLIIFFLKVFQGKLLNKNELGFVGIYFLLFLVVVSLQGLLPFYAGGFWYFDWFEHYQRSLFFTRHLPLNFQFGPYLLTARPPFFNIVVSFYQSVIGREFYHYQIIATLLNLCIALPVYLFCRDYFGLKKLKNLMLLISALILFNPAIMQQATFTWTKSLSAYFILLALFFYLFARDKNHQPSSYLSSLLLAGGFITHYSSLGYIIPVFLDYILLTFLIFKKRLLPLIISIFIIVSISFTWFGFAIRNYGLYNTFLGNTSYEWTKNMTFSNRLEKDITNFTYTFLPLISGSFLNYIKPQTSFLVKIFDLSTYFYFDTFPGSITLTLYALIVLYVLLNLKKWLINLLKINKNFLRIFSGSKYFFVFFIVGSIPFNLIVYPALTNVTASIIFFPLTLLLFSYGISRLIYFGKHLPKFILVIITSTIILEAILGVILRVFVLQTELNPNFNYKLKNPLLYHYQTLPVHMDNWNLKINNNLIFLYDRFPSLKPTFLVLVFSAWVFSFFILKKILRGKSGN